MAAPLKWSKNSPFQSFLLIGLFFFFFAHFLLLSPSSLEEDFGGMRILHPKDLLGFLQNEPETLTHDEFIRNTPPGYSLRDTLLFSTSSGNPALKLKSRKMNVYQEQQMAHLRDAEALIKESARVSAREATYDFKTGNMTFLGGVHAVFPNGVEIDSEIARVEPHPFLHITIPGNEKVSGVKPHPSTPVTFTALWLEYREDDDQTVHLLHEVEVKIRGAQKTVIRSDEARFSGNENRLFFSMDGERIIEHQFVTLSETDLDLKSRRIELRLDDGNELEEIHALQDVWFLDRHSKDRTTEGTGGKAVYRVALNQIVLSEFPQLYQDRDTITGDLITYHRDTDTVEVTESNAIYNNSK